MPRPSRLPDPKDRTVNEPTTYVNAAQVLGNYNQKHPNDKEGAVVPKVKDWFVQSAKQAGWNEVNFHGSGCLLTAQLTLVTDSTTK